MKFRAVFALPGFALTTAATALRILAAVNEALAERIAGAGDRTDDPETTTSAPPAGQARPAADTATAAPQTQTSTTIEPVDVAELAARTAPQVIAALDTLSTTDLADLYDYESRRRRRSTVLAAIEAAAAPPAAARDDDIVLDDPREPDVLVYSTASAKRSSG